MAKCIALKKYERVCLCLCVSVAEQSGLMLCWKVEYKKDFERDKSKFTPVPDTVEMRTHQQNKKNLEMPRALQRSRKSQNLVVDHCFHVQPILLCFAVFSHGFLARMGGKIHM